MNTLPTISAREITLQPILNAVHARITDHVLADADWQAHVEFQMQAMMLQLRKRVLSERLQGDVTVPVFVPLRLREPRSFLRWLWGMGPKVREFTVQATVTIPVASYNTFPESQIRYPDDLGRPVRLQVWEGENAA